MFPQAAHLCKHIPVKKKCPELILILDWQCINFDIFLYREIDICLFPQLILACVIIIVDMPGANSLCTLLETCWVLTHVHLYVHVCNCSHCEAAVIICFGIIQVLNLIIVYNHVPNSHSIYLNNILSFSPGYILFVIGLMPSWPLALKNGVSMTVQLFTLFYTKRLSKHIH